MELTRMICLFGPDGVGKSTHTRLIHELLSLRETRVKTVWIRGPHTLSYLLSIHLMKAGRVKETVNPYGRVKKTLRIGGGPIVKTIWASFELISVLPLVLFKVLIPYWMGYTIIADRYVLDTMVTIAYHIEDPTFIEGRLARTLFWLIPRGSVLIHLDAEYETLAQRRERLVEPAEFIEFQKKCYGWLSEQTSAHYIDTSEKPIEEVSARIIEIIREKEE